MSSPGNVGFNGVARGPVAVIRNVQVYVSPFEVVTLQRFFSSSRRAAVTRVLNSICLRRLKWSVIALRYFSTSGWVGKRSFHVHSIPISSKNVKIYTQLSESVLAPGYRFQYQVPPTLVPASNALAETPRLPSSYNIRIPPKPVPTTKAS